MGDCVAIARRHLRIGRVPIHLPASTCSEHRRVGEDINRLSRNRCMHSVTTTISFYEIEHSRSLENFYPLAVTHPVDQRARYFSARLITLSVHDPEPLMRGLAAKHEIRIAAMFKQAPDEFLRMIVVHELAHLREKDHGKAFYQLCAHMEPHYHQYEFDLRLYLTHMEHSGERLWGADAV